MGSDMGFIQYFKWQFLRNSYFAFFSFIVQILLSVGIIFGFSFLIPDIDAQTALYLITGAPAVIMLTTGLVMMSQMVAEDKGQGTIEYMLSWPLARWVYIAGDALYWFCMTLPGILLSFLVGSLYFNISIHIGFAGLAVLILIGLTAMSIGYAMAVLLPPKMTHLVSQILVFAIMLFSPINFPAERLPSWLAVIHRYLPMQHVAEAMRASFAPEYFTAEPASYLILTAWTIVSFGLSVFALRKRK